MLTSMVGGDDPRSSKVKINSPMRKLFEEWIKSKDLELMREATYLMRGFDADAVFYSLAESAVIKSEGDKQVQGGITAALSSGVSARNLGEPAPHLKKRMADLKAWHARSNSVIVVQFAEDLIDMTQREIDWLAQEDEEFLEEEG